MQHRCSLLALCAVVLVAITGCGGTLPSSRGYVLARPGDKGLVALASDDPTYDTFDSEVMTDPLIAHLMSLFDGISGAYAATSLSSDAPQTLRNYPIIVVSHGQPGLLRSAQVRGSGRHARVEYAIALGVGEGADLGRQAREALPGLLTQLLLAAAGHQPPDGLLEAASDCACVDGDVALWQGYMTLQEARHANGAWALDAELSGQGPLAEKGAGYWACCPAQGHLSGEDACLCGRGMAGFLAELLDEMPAAYPQRYMLWFANYESAEAREAKLLLALARMAGNEGDALERFVGSYADTFPAEADHVRDSATLWRERMAAGKS